MSDLGDVESERESFVVYSVSGFVAEVVRLWSIRLISGDHPNSYEFGYISHGVDSKKFRTAKPNRERSRVFFLIFP